MKVSVELSREEMVALTTALSMFLQERLVVYTGAPPHESSNLNDTLSLELDREHVSGYVIALVTGKQYLQEFSQACDSASRKLIGAIYNPSYKE